MERNSETLKRYQFDIQEYRQGKDNQYQMMRYNDKKTKPNGTTGR